MFAIFKRVRLKLRQARRVGAFIRARERGLSDVEARAYSDTLYPLKGKQVGNDSAVAAVRANAAHRAAGLKSIVDSLRAKGITSVRMVAEELNAREVLTPRGAQWHPTSAARLLARLQ
jgi:hypothetical protein